MDRLSHSQLNDVPLIEFNTVTFYCVKGAIVLVVSSKGEDNFVEGDDTGTVSFLAHGLDGAPDIFADAVHLAEFHVVFSVVASEHEDGVSAAILLVLEAHGDRGEECALVDHRRLLEEELVLGEQLTPLGEVVRRVTPAQNEHAHTLCDEGFLIRGRWHTDEKNRNLFGTFAALNCHSFFPKSNL